MPSPRSSDHPPLSRSTSRFPTPGLFLSVEFGISSSPDSVPYTASMTYTSRNMAQRQQSRGEAIARSWEEPGLPPAYAPTESQNGTAGHPQQQTQGRRRRRSYRFGGWNRDRHARGHSAPPSWSDRAESSPSIAPQHQQPFPFYTKSSFSSSDRPLPSTPSQFRLGDASLPWSTPPFHPNSSVETGDYESADTEDGMSLSRTTEDPQRIQHLSTLQQAMMTVDTLDGLDQDGWEMWSFERERPVLEDGEEVEGGEQLVMEGRGRGRRNASGNRSLGWAVEDGRMGVVGNTELPPPYVVSQWEEMDGRRRSSG